MDEKTKDELTLAFVLVLLALFVGVFGSSIGPSEIKSKCLEQLAEIYCAEKGLELKELNGITFENKNGVFTCFDSKDRRAENNQQKFVFLKEERDYCKQECIKENLGIAKVHC